MRQSMSQIRQRTVLRLSPVKTRILLQGLWESFFSVFFFLARLIGNPHSGQIPPCIKVPHLGQYMIDTSWLKCIFYHYCWLYPDFLYVVNQHSPYRLVLWLLMALIICRPSVSNSTISLCQVNSWRNWCDWKKQQPEADGSWLKCGHDWRRSEPCRKP